MNLSNEINKFIQKHEYLDFSSISFGTVIYNIAKEYDLRSQSEEECIKALDGLKETWLKYEYIRETTPASTLESLCKREAKTLEDIEKIISEEFEIFEVTVEEHDMYNHRFEIRYYRTPVYCNKRHYIEVTVLTEPDFSTIKKILNVSKGV